MDTVRGFLLSGAMSDATTEDALNVTLAHPGTNYLAPIDEIKNMLKCSIFPTANYPYPEMMKKPSMKSKKKRLQIELAKF